MVLAVLGWMGLVTARGLWQFNKYALILSAVVGGVLTPGPDVLSQMLMAGPAVRPVQPVDHRWSG